MATERRREPNCLSGETTLCEELPYSCSNLGIAATSKNSSMLQNRWLFRKQSTEEDES